MAEILNVTSHEGDYDEAAQQAQQALDDVVAWFVDDGFSNEEIEERVAESIDRNREE